MRVSTDIGLSILCGLTVVEDQRSVLAVHVFVEQVCIPLVIQITSTKCLLLGLNF